MNKIWIGQSAGKLIKENFMKAEIFEIYPEDTNYLVSNLGRVKNVTTGKFKVPRVTSDGYLRMTTYPSRKTTGIHRLVLKTFEPNINCDNLQVNHINGLRDDNRLENLEWVTSKENANKRVFVQDLKGENNPSSILSDTQALEIRNNYDESIRDSEIATHYNVSRSIIMKIRNGTSYTHVGGNIMEKGRYTGSQGSKVHTALLDETDVYKIRFETSSYTTRELSDKYAVSISVIQRIRKGTTWKHVVKN